MIAPRLQDPAKPPVSFRRLLAFAALIFALTLAARLWWLEPMFPQIDPKGIVAARFAAILSLGIGLILILAHANRHRWRAVLRPNRGRIIGAVVLASVTPLVVFSWVPFIVGGAAAFFLGVALTETNETTGAALYVLALLIALTAFWYPISCLIVSGLASRWARVAVFCLMFWTSYSVIILAVGNQIFRL